MIQSDYPETQPKSVGGATCPFCGKSDSQPSDGESWWCPNCHRDYPTKAYKCQHSGCWGYVSSGAYCERHKSDKTKAAEPMADEKIAPIEESKTVNSDHSPLSILASYAVAAFAGGIGGIWLLPVFFGYSESEALSYLVSYGVVGAIAGILFLRSKR
jgi:hypothetical protein